MLALKLFYYTRYSVIMYLESALLDAAVVFTYDILLFFHYIFSLTTIITVTRYEIYLWIIWCCVSIYLCMCINMYLCNFFSIHLTIILR